MKPLILTLTILATTAYADPRCQQNGVGSLVCDTPTGQTTYQTDDAGDVVYTRSVTTRPLVIPDPPVNCQTNPYSIACPNPYARPWGMDRDGD